MVHLCIIVLCVRAIQLVLEQSGGDIFPVGRSCFNFSKLTILCASSLQPTACLTRIMHPGISLNCGM